jgi:hypothetical protein
MLAIEHCTFRILPGTSKMLRTWGRKRVSQSTRKASSTDESRSPAKQGKTNDPALRKL